MYVHETFGLMHNTATMTTPRLLRRTQNESRTKMTLVLALAAAALMTWVPGGRIVAARAQGQPQAQAENPCALLNTDEVQALAPKKVSVSAGVSSAIQAAGVYTCRFMWGAGVERATLSVTVNPAARMFAGMNGDAIKAGLLASVVPNTNDEAINDIGEAAVFKVYSYVYAGASAYVKDRILQVNLDDLDARDRKPELIALLKSAASRL